MAEAANQLLPAGAIYFMMSEDDVRRVLSYPHTMIGSDGLPHDEHPHPRLWGTFPRVLGHYVRDVKLFPLEEAVRRMTALPAAQFGLKDRGRLQRRRLSPIWCCSIRATIADTATFEKPKTPAAGIALVMVNGRTVWNDGAATGAPTGTRAAAEHARADGRRACRIPESVERWPDSCFEFSVDRWEYNRMNRAFLSGFAASLLVCGGRGHRQRPNRQRAGQLSRRVRRRSSCRSRRAATPTSSRASWRTSSPPRSSSRSPSSTSPAPAPISARPSSPTAIPTATRC